MNEESSLSSTSSIPFAFAMSLDRRSRVAFVKLRMRTTSYAVYQLYIRTYSTAKGFYLPSQLVLFDASEIKEVIKVLAPKLGFAQGLVTELAPALHDRS